MQIEPVRRRSLAEGVFDALTTAILHGTLEPGQALPAEPALAQLLGVRRGVLREGIKRLEQAGLVEPRQGGGTFVCDWRRRAGLDLLPALLQRPDGSFDPEVARSVMQMRTALAPDVARQAAERRDAAQLARLQQCVLALAEAPEHELRAAEGPGAEALPAFWDALVDASGNLAYRLAYNALLSVARGGGTTLRRLLAPEVEPLSDYASLAAAVAEGDGDGAHALAARIVRRGEAALSAWFDAAGPAAAAPARPPAPALSEARR